MKPLIFTCTTLLMILLYGAFPISSYMDFIDSLDYWRVLLETSEEELLTLKQATHGVADRSWAAMSTDDTGVLQPQGSLQRLSMSGFGNETDWITCAEDIAHTVVNMDKTWSKQSKFNKLIRLFILMYCIYGYLDGLFSSLYNFFSVH